LSRKHEGEGRRSGRRGVRPLDGQYELFEVDAEGRPLVNLSRRKKRRVGPLVTGKCTTVHVRRFRNGKVSVEQWREAWRL